MWAEETLGAYFKNRFIVSRTLIIEYKGGGM